MAGLELKAPDGWLLAQVVVLPQREPRTLAWLRKEEAPNADSQGELWQLTPRPRSLARFPGFVPNGKSCLHHTRLKATGSAAAVLQVDADCPELPLMPGSPRGSLQFFDVFEKPKLLATLRIGRPADPQDRLKVDADSPDVDGDGHEDVVLEGQLVRGKQRASARWVWLNRAAGLVSYSAEPAQSFAAQAQRHPAVGDGVEAMGNALDMSRRLFTYLCAESGRSLVFDQDGVALPCGELPEAAKEVLRMSVRAALAEGRSDLALFELQRATWFALAPPKTHASLYEQLLASTLKAAHAVDAHLETLQVEPSQPGPQPQYSPLSYAPGGALWIQSPDGLFEWRAGRVSEVSESVPTWSLVPRGPTGERFGFVELPCDRSSIALMMLSPTGSMQRVEFSRWLAPRPGLCSGAPPLQLPALRPVGFDSSGAPEAIWGPLLFTPSGAFPTVKPPPSGSPLSPSAHYGVAETPWGPLVFGRAGVKSLWRVPAPQVSHCVVNDDASELACLRAERVVVLRPEPSP